jgi:hypothetical protein
MKENTDGVATAYGILVLLHILAKSIGATNFYDLHSHAVQCLDWLVDGTMVLIIVCVFVPNESDDYSYSYTIKWHIYTLTATP